MHSLHSISRIVLEDTVRYCSAQAALLTALHADDRALIGGQWCAPAAVWRRGRSVEAVHCQHLQTLALGTRLTVVTPANKVVLVALINGLHMAEADHLTPDELAALGCTSRLHLDEVWGPAPLDRVWLVHFVRVA